MTPALRAESGNRAAITPGPVAAIDALVEAMAEDKGVEGTLKEGKGPIYRQRMDELEKMQGAYKIQDDRVKDAKKRLDTADGT